MNNYLNISSRYLSAHKKRSRLIIFSVVMAVALVVGIFSMLDSLIRFERVHVLKSEGNYHILIRNPKENEISSISSRIDVKNAGMMKDLGKGSINGRQCALGSLDENFAENLNFVLATGRYPSKPNEVMLEKWFMDEYYLKIGDAVTVSLPDKSTHSYVISGMYKDWGATKAAAIPIVFMQAEGTVNLTCVSSQYFVLFKDGVNIQKAEKDISGILNITEERIGYNEGLLALMLQTKNNRVIKIYAIGAVLFSLVLITAVVMIYNTFNISVMERIRQFGLLRCIGASKAQIKRLVRRESILISFKAIPFGVLAGILMTFAGSAVLKYYNSSIYGDISIFNFSIIGILAGILTGILTVSIASFVPAKIAAKVSPVNAVTGNNEIEISKRTKNGFLTKVFKAEIAIGINNAINKKKTLILMSSSIAVSIILFLGFSVLVNPKLLGMNSTKAYTADISVSSAEGINKDLFKKVSEMDGIKNVYGRMSTFVRADFNTSRLTKSYALEKSWLISYDKMQLKWAKEYLSEGTCNETKLDEQNGIIAVNKIYRNDELVATMNFQIGDKVYIKTDAGDKEFTVMGIADSIPYSTDEQILTTFITTEKLFKELSDNTKYKTVDIQLKKNDQNTVSEIKKIFDESVTLKDRRQFNAEADNAFMTVAVFIYSFIGVIAFISVLNIINTMNTSVISKTQYFGVMRAVGMSGKQLSRMVLAQAVTYSLTGCIVGCVFGIVLQKKLLDFLALDWKFPVLQISLIFIFSIFTAVFSVIGPLRRINAKGISEIIGSI